LVRRLGNQLSEGVAAAVATFRAAALRRIETVSDPEFKARLL
jgi:hypothetical protein